MNKYEQAFEAILTMQRLSLEGKITDKTFNVYTKRAPTMQVIGTYYGVCLRSAISNDKWFRWKPPERLLDDLIASQRADFAAKPEEIQCRILAMCASPFGMGAMTVQIKPEVEFKFLFRGAWIIGMSFAGPQEWLDSLLVFDGKTIPYMKLKERLKKFREVIKITDFDSTMPPMEILGREVPWEKIYVDIQHGVHLDLNGKVAVVDRFSRDQAIAAVDGQVVSAELASQLQKIVESLTRSLQ